MVFLLLLAFGAVFSLETGRRNLTAPPSGLAIRIQNRTVTACWCALALARVAIERTAKSSAKGGSADATGHLAEFFLGQFPCARTSQDSFVLIHTFSPFLEFGAVSGPNPNASGTFAWEKATRVRNGGPTEPPKVSRSSAF
jgi:hypothetical protein